MGNADRTWFERAWDHPVGRFLVTAGPVLATTAMLDLLGRDVDYAGAAVSGFGVWAILLWQRPLSRRRR
jgi:hypothetical protein